MDLPVSGCAILLAATFFVLVTANTCTTTYSSSGRPLLFGGVTQRCQKNCQSRDDYWGKRCSFNAWNGHWGVCTDQQAQRSFDVVKTIAGGAILNLQPCELLPFLRGRTLWIIGDSHAKSLYQALQCFLLDFWNHKECESSPDAWKVEQLLKLPASPGQSHCLHLLGQGGGRVCLVHAVLGTSLYRNDQVADGGVLPLLRNKFASRQDIFYVNFGIWHKKAAEWNKSYKVALKNLGELYQSTKKEWPHLLFKETPAEHQRSQTNDYCLDARGFLYNTNTGMLEFDPAARPAGYNWNTQWRLGILLNDAADRILGGYNIPVVPGFNASVPLSEAHLGKHMTKDLDCVHYCQPGIPQTWIWYMYQAFKSGVVGIKPIPESRPATFQCVASKQRWLN